MQNKAVMFDKCIDKQGFMKISAQLLGKKENTSQQTQQMKTGASMFNDAYSDTVKLHSRNDKQHFTLASSNSYSAGLDHAKNNQLLTQADRNLAHTLPLETE